MANTHVFVDRVTNISRPKCLDRAVASHSAAEPAARKYFTKAVDVCVVRQRRGQLRQENAMSYHSPIDQLGAYLQVLLLIHQVEAIKRCATVCCPDWWNGRLGKRRDASIEEWYAFRIVAARHPEREWLWCGGIVEHQVGGLDKRFCWRTRTADDVFGHAKLRVLGIVEVHMETEEAIAM